MPQFATQTVHATCVACNDKAVLICGASGSGKSSLALEMIALGAVLVADDRTLLRVEHSKLIASSPPEIAGLIEARGVGILNSPCVSDIEIVCMVEMGHVETARLPHTRKVSWQGIEIPCFNKVEQRAFPSALLHYLRYGGVDIS